MDFLKLEPDRSGYQYILVITDHFSRYAQAVPTRDKSSRTVARVLWEQYFLHYGIPKRLHSDQGREFDNNLIKGLASLLGVSKSRTTPYHPQGDPQPDRFNRTLLNMLGTLPVDKKHTWSKFVAPLVHAYNSTRNDSTGFSPYHIMFGREARLPIDVCFGTAPNGVSHKECSEYVKNLRRSLENAYQRASDEAAKSAAANKQRHDMKVRVVSCTLVIGCSSGMLASKASIRLQTNGIKKFTLLSGGLMIIFLCTGSSQSLSLITSEPSIGI